jgi:DNA-binding helix-hairpin-helix protein with protein kinase domain
MKAPPSATRTGTSKAGTQNGRLVPCAVSPESHGFHPENEDCPYCESVGPTLNGKQLEFDLSDIDPYIGYFV